MSRRQFQHIFTCIRLVKLHPAVAFAKCGTPTTEMLLPDLQSPLEAARQRIASLSYLLLHVVDGQCPWAVVPLYRWLFVHMPEGILSSEVNAVRRSEDTLGITRQAQLQCYYMRLSNKLMRHRYQNRTVVF